MKYLTIDIDPAAAEYGRVQEQEVDDHCLLCRQARRPGGWTHLAHRKRQKVKPPVIGYHIEASFEGMSKDGLAYNGSVVDAH